MPLRGVNFARRLGVNIECRLTEGLAGHVPTALIALDLDDALAICDKLNRRLGLTREQWTELAAKSMRAETHEPGDPSAH